MRAPSTPTPIPSDLPEIPPERSRPRMPRVYSLSLALSAVLHLIFIVLYPLLVPAGPRGGLPPPPAAPAAPSGIEVIRIVEVPATTLENPAEPEEEEPEEEEPEEEEEPMRVEVAPAAADSIPPPAEADSAERVPTAAERLRPPERGDARIWRSVDPSLVELSAEEKARLRLYGLLENWNDSIAAAAAAAGEALDWTYTDADGKKWGISPGLIHLGDVTVPMPFGFGGATMNREKIQHALWELDQIQRGAQTVTIRRHWKARIKAIRERKDAERRKKARADTTGTSK